MYNRKDHIICILHYSFYLQFNLIKLFLGNPKIVWCDQFLENALGAKALALTEILNFIYVKLSPIELEGFVPYPPVWVQESIWNVPLPPTKYKVLHPLRDVLKVEAEQEVTAYQVMDVTSKYLKNRENQITDKRNLNIFMIYHVEIGAVFRVAAFKKDQLWSLLLPHLLEI